MTNGIEGMEPSGRILPLYKGDYVSTKTYEGFDIVLYKNSSYIAKQITVGNEPQENDEYWQLVAKGIVDADVSDATVEFEEADNREDIQSGEKIKTLFGKIKKMFSDLKTVAFTNDYNDLDNTPSTPTVNNGTLTIQKNGANIQTFTANQNGNATANITVPTAAGDIGAVAASKIMTTKEQIDANTDANNVAGAVALKSIKSDLTNSINQVNSNLDWKDKDTQITFASGKHLEIDVSDFGVGSFKELAIIIGLNGINLSNISLNVPVPNVGFGFHYDFGGYSYHGGYYRLGTTVIIDIDAYSGFGLNVLFIKHILYR